MPFNVKSERQLHSSILCLATRRSWVFGSLFNVEWFFSITLSRPGWFNHLKSHQVPCRIVSILKCLFDVLLFLRAVEFWLYSNIGIWWQSLMFHVHKVCREKIETFFPNHINPNNWHDAWFRSQAGKVKRKECGSIQKHVDSLSHSYVCSGYKLFTYYWFLHCFCMSMLGITQRYRWIDSSPVYVLLPGWGTPRSRLLCCNTSPL